MKKYEITDERGIFCGKIAESYHHINPSSKSKRGCLTNAERQKCIAVCNECHQKYFHPTKKELFDKLEISCYRLKYVHKTLRKNVIYYLEHRGFCSECGKAEKKLHIVMNSDKKQFYMETNDSRIFDHVIASGFINSVNTLCTKCAIKYVSNCNYKELQFHNQKTFKLFRKKYHV